MNGDESSMARPISPGGDAYETALRVLFDLDPGAVEAVTRADAGPVTGSPQASAPPPEQEAT